MTNTAAALGVIGRTSSAKHDYQPMIVCPECGEPCYGAQVVFAGVEDDDTLIEYDCRICGTDQQVWESELQGKSTLSISIADVPF